MVFRHLVRGYRASPTRRRTTGPAATIRSEEMNDTAIHDVLATLVTLFACGYGVMFLYRVLRRGRPELSIGLPLFVAFGLRLVSLVALPLTGIERTLRGGDEVGFLASAADTASSTFGSGAWLDSLTGALYEFIFATQIALFDSPELTLRITQLTISVLGLMLLAVAVYELAGRRAALVAMWVLALEPTNIFFSTYLHKEPNMILASGMVAFGGTMIWKYGDVRWIALITTGCLIAVATRPYAGWFLIAAGAAIMLHAGLRQGAAGGVRRFGLIAVVLLFGAIAAPTVLEASTDESLEQNLQGSQDANAADADANLSLEQVDFSSRTAIVTNLHRRVIDVLAKPYPWQLANISQRLGAIGALITLTALYLLVVELLRNRGAIMARAGPLLYVGLALLLAYSLSAGNAGTAFRYRTHILVLVVCALVALRFARKAELARVAPVGHGPKGGDRPISARQPLPTT